MVFREAKLVIKNKNQTLFQNNKNNNRKKEVETGASFHQFKAAGLVVAFGHNGHYLLSGEASSRERLLDEERTGGLGHDVGCGKLGFG